jgi:hypothetical protein
MTFTLVGATFLPLNEFQPSLISIFRSGSHRLNLDIEIVRAAIDHEINFAAIRQKIRLIGDRPGNRFVVEQHLRHCQLINLLGDSSVITFGIGAAGLNRLLKLSQQHIATNDACRDQFAILRANCIDETIKLGLLMDHAYKVSYLGNHTSRLRRIWQFRDPADPVEP